MVNDAREIKPGPLAGLKVLDMSRHLAGPHATMTLGDLGADVIKLERPGAGDDARGWAPHVDGESCYFMSINRNKRSVVVDLADASSKEIVRGLIEWADVLVENFRPGALDRWGYDGDTLRRWNLGLIHCSITAFGSHGPYRDRPGMDLLLQASGGLMSITGEPDRPPVRIGISMIDLIAGASAVQGVLAALYERERSGLGQDVEISLQDGLMSWLSYHVTSYLMTGTEPTRTGASHPSVAPYDAYPTKDGFLVIAIGTDGLWADLCAALGRAELAADPRFETNRARCANRADLDKILVSVLTDRSASDWAGVLAERGVPCSPVRSLSEVLADPGLEARQPVTATQRGDGTTIPAPSIPLRFSRTPGSVRLPPPLLGEHTIEVLTNLDANVASSDATVD
jgi:crotonobetainyl-CoA:carnitine CoA-transferase CaiB-like acyl-CoA transferase